MPHTRILAVPEPDSLGQIRSSGAGGSSSSEATTTTTIDHWDISLPAPGSPPSPSLAALQTAAACLRESDVPVGFPTETVYGLAADATRSAAVLGIFAAKGRPADNPLIVHVCDLAMLRQLLRDSSAVDVDADAGVEADADTTTKPNTNSDSDPIPAIYWPLIERFWPGPLTILLQKPAGSRLAPQVTAGLSTFGARLPASPLARSLIRLAGAPLAAPSANASTRPSPTTAQHVVDDLAGRIALVLDGGPCLVGVESTVVDAVSCSPPVVLRPGGIALADLRSVPGWEHVQRAYDDSESGELSSATSPPNPNSNSNNTNNNIRPKSTPRAPRAPGMKYKHYSPRARVLLFEHHRHESWSSADLRRQIQSATRAGAGTASPSAGADKPQPETRKPPVLGVIRTGGWPALVDPQLESNQKQQQQQQQHHPQADTTYSLTEHVIDSLTNETPAIVVLDIDLGGRLESVAHGLFRALRDLDARGADVILVEGLDDHADDLAVAVMNRLRKAASELR